MLQRAHNHSPSLHWLYNLFVSPHRQLTGAASPSHRWDSKESWERTHGHDAAFGVTVSRCVPASTLCQEASAAKAPCPTIPSAIASASGPADSPLSAASASAAQQKGRNKDELCAAAPQPCASPLCSRRVANLSTGTHLSSTCAGARGGVGSGSPAAPARASCATSMSRPASAAFPTEQGDVRPAEDKGRPQTPPLSRIICAPAPSAGTAPPTPPSRWACRDT